VVNAEKILSLVIGLVIFEGYTFGEAFLRINMDDIEKNSLFNYSAMKQRVKGMLAECQTMVDVQQRFFNHYASY